MNVFDVCSRDEVEDLTKRMDAKGISPLLNRTMSIRALFYSNKNIFHVTAIDTLDEMPLFIGDKDPIVRTVAEWRLEIGK